MKKHILLLILSVGIGLHAQAPFLQHRNLIKIENWKFLKGVTNDAENPIFDDAQWQNVKVPHTYSMDAINDIGYYKGEAWYRTTFEAAASMNEQRTYIRFEGVGQEATVYLNGKKIGTHIGGYSAFCYEITNLIKSKGQNVLAVNVTNAPNFKRIPIDDALFNHYGGIYRPVQLFSTPKSAITPTYFASSGVFVEATKVTPDKAQMEVRTHLSTIDNQSNSILKYSLKNAENKVVFEKIKSLNTISKDTIIVSQFEIAKPILWNGRINPHQYTLDVQLITDGSVDKVSQKFGIKTFAIDGDKGFILNNKEYRLNGVSKHQEWEQVGPAVSDENLVADMELIDEIGATSLRLSHYQHSDKTYELADEKGVLVWSEIPFVHDWSSREGGNANQQLKELILQNYNHPSIFVWGLWNEVRSWNGDKAPAVVLTKELNQLAHKLDKTRMTTSASDRDMVDDMGGITDLQAWNKYFGWYGNSIEEMATWLDKSHREHPEIKIGLSEYGAGGNINHQDITKLDKPKGNYFPEMEQSRYHEITWKILKDRPFVWGTFVWNMFDFSVAGWNRGGIKNLNHKGLVTFDRKTKKDAFYFYKANWSKAPVLYIAERRNNVRTTAMTSIKVYTNLIKVTLYVNNKKIKTQKLESDINVITFDAITLNKGKNEIKIISADKSSKLEDEVKWELKN
ncbi:glycoside hydrolase family 2 protein [Flavobacterium sp. 7A]|uniref:glycoside hydrolase family 2 protein n=1 Tax=Flavobacterium sp. 7A TaxID=2940571 RepID=UPI002226A4B8|nr:glycoside hydrolase family 2 TIM barrel-domain containing protein [Flavobacterium sp. 7A]MCW2118806.1 beta-galactosidase [Flavobacterium sp. 7A]